MHRTNGLIVGIEEEVPPLPERPERRRMPGQQEGLEEPGGVAKMPLERAGRRHGLHAAVLGIKAIHERQGTRSGAPKCSPAESENATRDSIFCRSEP